MIIILYYITIFFFKKLIIIKYRYLQNNQLTGSIPPEVEKLTLERLLVKKNYKKNLYIIYYLYKNIK